MRYNNPKITGGSNVKPEAQAAQTTGEIRMDSQPREAAGATPEASNHSSSNFLDSGDTPDISRGDSVMKIIAIYDNGGRTLDRYTVVTDAKYSTSFVMALGVGADPADFSQWTGAVKGDHLGTVVPFEELSAKLQEHIALRVFGKDE
jgi:hypothetical protein